MALLTKTGINNILRRIMETTGLNPEVETDIQRLQADFEEKEGFLKTYGETYEGDELEEYEFKGREISQIEPDEDYKLKYQDLKQKYLDRFFGGNSTEVEEVKEEQKEDIIEDGEQQTFDSLFKKREE